MEPRSPEKFEGSQRNVNFSKAGACCKYQRSQTQQNQQTHKHRIRNTAGMGVGYFTVASLEMHAFA